MEKDLEEKNYKSMWRNRLSYHWAWSSWNIKNLKEKYVKVNKGRVEHLMKKEIIVKYISSINKIY